VSAGQLGCERGVVIYEWLRSRCADPAKKEKLIARLSRNIEHDASGCVLWTGALNNKGYGKMNIRLPGRVHCQIYVHHVFFILGNARPIADGMTIDHTCRTRHCINPAHHEEVTTAVNNRRIRRDYHA
jgi:hypothetical protein